MGPSCLLQKLGLLLAHNIRNPIRRLVSPTQGSINGSKAKEKGDTEPLEWPKVVWK